MALKRFNRQLSPTKPEGMRPSTWSMIQGHHARRAALLSGRGHVKKMKAIAKHHWETKDAAGSYTPKIVTGHGHATPKAASPTKAKRIRMGSPLRHIPKSFTRKSFGA